MGSMALFAKYLVEQYRDEFPVGEMLSRHGFDRLRECNTSRCDLALAARRSAAKLLSKDEALAVAQPFGGGPVQHPVDALAQPLRQGRLFDPTG
jgi:hypothetical protein